MGGNHPNNQTSEANQWPHHFEMLGQLLFGFIFLIVVAFLYIVRATPARFAREATTPLDDVSQFLALTSPFPALLLPLPQTYYLRGKRAERLARIAVSDIVLYNEEKFAAAVRSEDPLQAMRDEVEEGRALLRGRIEEAVFATRDFVGDELLRQVRERA